MAIATIQKREKYPQLAKEFCLKYSYSREKKITNSQTSEWQILCFLPLLLDAFASNLKKSNKVNSYSNNEAKTSSVADPGCLCLSRIQLFSILDPGSKFFQSRILDQKRISVFFFYPNMIRVAHPKSRIRILTFYPSRILDPGVKKEPDPGSGSATLKTSNVGHFV